MLTSQNVVTSWVSRCYRVVGDVVGDVGVGVGCGVVVRFLREAAAVGGCGRAVVLKPFIFRTETTTTSRY